MHDYKTMIMITITIIIVITNIFNNMNIIIQ